MPFINWFLILVFAVIIIVPLLGALFRSFTKSD